MKTRASKFEPKTYLPSKSDRNYSKEAAKYAVFHIFLCSAKWNKWVAKGAPTDLSTSAEVAEMKEALAADLTDLIAQGWKEAPYGKGKATFSDKAAEHVIGAMHIFEVDALRLLPVDEPIVRGQDSSDSRLPGLTRMDQLGVSVCNVIRHWHDQAKKGKLEERRRAREHLKKVCEALIPDSRGKRGSSLTVPPLDILLYYYKEMFRLYHIQNALRSMPGRTSEKVKAASENFGMTVEQIRELWNLDDTDKPKGRPVPIKEMARILTARQFNITQHAVSNMIALYPQSLDPQKYSKNTFFQ